MLKNEQEQKNLEKLPIVSKPIQVEGVTLEIHMMWAYCTVEEFKQWYFRNSKNEDGWSAAMKVTIWRKSWFKKIPTHEIYTHERPDKFVVKIYAIKD